MMMLATVSRMNGVIIDDGIAVNYWVQTQQVSAEKLSLFEELL